MSVRTGLPKLLLVMPLPPPYSGQETITQMLLASPLRERFQIIHLDTSNKVSNVNRGRLDLRNVVVTLKNSFHLLWLLWRERPELANIPMPKNRFGFIKFTSFVLPCAWSGAKVVSRSGGGHFDKFYENEAAWMKKLIRYTLDHVDTVIVRADCLKRPFEPFMPAESIWTVYLGLDPQMFGNVSASKASDSGINVLYVGHLSKAKGALDLLEAVPGVLSRHPNTRFRFAGDILKQERNITFIDNPEDNETVIHKHLSRDGVREAVELLGIVRGEAKLQAFYESDIFVLPSYAEGFPFAVLEAMLAGKAVIATPVGALPEVFEHEKHLLFVEPGHVEGIAEAINRLAQDVELRERLGQAARERVRSKFNLHSLADRMTQVFDYALESESV